MKNYVRIVLFVCCFGILNVFAQEEKTEIKNFDLVLQIIVANNSTEKIEIPQNLSTVVKKLKANYNYQNYRLDKTFVHRVSVNSQIENKSLLHENRKNPTFLEWSLYLKSELKSIFIDNFRIGLRIPIELQNSVTNYEQIGFANKGFRVIENSPVLIGSLLGPKPENFNDEMMFVVLTLKTEN